MEIKTLFFIDNVQSKKGNKLVRKIDGDITLEHANQFENEFDEPNNIVLLATEITSKGSVKNSGILGFSFPKCEIIKALGDDSNLGIHLSFAYNDGSVSNGRGGVKGKEGVTVILYGIDKDSKLIKVYQKVFDYSKPCPKNCPGGRDNFELPSNC